MGTNLFRFVFNTLQIRLNDPTKQLWLPRLLQNAKGANPDGKLLPLHQDNWPVGEITGESGEEVMTTFVQNFEVAYYTATKKTPPEFDPPIENASKYSVISTPDHELPVLDLSRLVVEGLQNVFVEPEPEVIVYSGGYRATITITFGTAKDPNLPKTVRLSGRYQLSQSVSMSSDGATVTTDKLDKAPFDWPTQVITGTGMFALDVTQVRAVADVLFTVDPKGTRVSVDHLEFQGTKDEPVINIDEKDITIDNVNTNMATQLAWKGLAKVALESTDGRAALVKGMNETLNQEDNRKQLSDTLTDSLRSQLDNAIGPTTGDARSVDEDIFARLKLAVNDEHSHYYLPVALLGITSPALDPYQLGDLDPIELNIPDIGSGTLALHDTVVEGIANALAPADRIAFDPGVKATATLSALPDGTEVTVDGGGTHKLVKPLVVHAKPVLTLDGDTLEDPAYWFKVTVIGPTTELVLGTSGGAANRLDTMVVTLESAVFAASDVEAEVYFDSTFDDLINQELAKNKEDIHNKLVDAVNKGIEQSRPQIGQSITARLRDLIASKLDN